MNRVFFKALGIIVGVAAIIVGLVFAFDTSTQYIGSSIEFGGDFYTEQYNVSRRVGEAVNDTYVAIRQGFGWLFILGGAFTVAFFGAMNVSDEITVVPTPTYTPRTAPTPTPAPTPTAAAPSAPAAPVAPVSSIPTWKRIEMEREAGAKAVPAAPAEPTADSWLCECGRSNAHYVSSCACGKSKREAIIVYASKE